MPWKVCFVLFCFLEGSFLRLFQLNSLDMAQLPNCASFPLNFNQENINELCVDNGSL